jgi:hypothetical protein
MELTTTEDRKSKLYATINRWQILRVAVRKVLEPLILKI